MTAQTVPPKRKGMPSSASQSLTQVDKARKTQLIVLRQTKTKGLEQPAQAKRSDVEEGRLCIEFLTGFTGIFERWTFDGLIRQRNVLSPATRVLPTTGSGHQQKGAAEGRSGVQSKRRRIEARQRV